jgi:hypothetical protein
LATPPEVLFHRYFQIMSPHQAPVRPEDADNRRYRGKQDLSLLPADQQSFLSRLQQGMNEALRNEKQNVPEHTDHPPFHFDSIDSKTENAAAFQYEGYSFIGATIPLIYRLWDVGLRLSRSERIIALLRLDLAGDDREALHIVLLQILTSLIVSHEYTHQVHGHVSPDGPRSAEYEEILDSGESGSLEEQILEADADGYAVYHVLANLIDGPARSAVDLLRLAGEAAERQDQVLLSCFVLAVAAYLFLRPAPTLDSVNIYRLTHPPQAARMNLIMHDAIAWCKQNRPHLVAWMTVERFQVLMAAVAEAMLGKGGSANWQAQSEFLRSADGDAYFRRVDAGVKAHVQAL